MSQKSFEHIKQLSPDIFENIALLLKLYEEGESPIRIAVLNKFSDDFSSDKFVSRFYPLNQIISIFDKSLNSDIEEELTEALCCIPEINLNLARKYALKLVHHQSKSVCEEALSILGYTGHKADETLLNSYLNSDIDESLSIAAYLSLLRLELTCYYQKCEEMILFVSDDGLCELLTGFCTLVELYDFSNILPMLNRRIEKNTNETLELEFRDLRSAIEINCIKNEIHSLNTTKGSDIKRLFFLFDHPDKNVRFYALSHFGAGLKPNKNVMPIEPPDMVVFDKIKSMINDSDDAVRSEVLSILGDWQRSEDILFICQNLNDESELVRIDAMHALGDIGNTVALNYIDDYLNEKKSALEKVRYLNTCIRLGLADYFDEWLSYIGDSNSLVRENIVGNIWNVITIERTPLLVQKLKSSIEEEPYLLVFNEMKTTLRHIEKITLAHNKQGT
jgi:HEAT repeat protein